MKSNKTVHKERKETFKSLKIAKIVHGRTFNVDDLVGGKVVVYSGTKKMLCTGSKLKMLGFID